MKILLTGSTGQLGASLLKSVPEGIEVIGLDRSQCDLGNPEQCRSVVLLHRPDVVINAAAYTQVDRAETERDLAFQVNAEAPRILAQALAETGGRLIQISTDFVFDGNQGKPYVPNALCIPQNIYGASKRSGEEAVLGCLAEKAVVLRSAWIYSAGSSNFVSVMLRLLNTKEHVFVVNDQIGTPTWALSLAKAVWAAVLSSNLSGIVHWTDSGVASRYDFAVAIQEEAIARGLIVRPAVIVPVSTQEYSQQVAGLAQRPSFSVLSVRASEALLGMTLVHWRTNLRLMLDELAA